MRFFYVRFLASFAQGAITHYFDHGKGQILVWSIIIKANIFQRDTTLRMIL